MKKLIKKIISLLKKILINDFFHKYLPLLGVNVGSGRSWKFFRFIGLDRLNGERLDKDSTFPFKDTSLKFVYSSHFIEHVTDDVVENFMNESFRILKRKGVIRIITPDFEKLHNVLLQDDINFYDDFGFKGRKEWEKYGVEKNLVNFTLHFFANYQNIEFEESEKTDFNNPDFYRGPPKIDENLVLQKAKTCDTLDFGSWVISHIPKEYFDFNGHINTFTFEKISQMLKNAGFVNVRRTNIAESKVSQFNYFDKNPSRENISIYVEANKP